MCVAVVVGISGVEKCYGVLHPPKNMHLVRGGFNLYINLHFNLRFNLRFNLLFNLAGAGERSGPRGDPDKNG